MSEETPVATEQEPTEEQDMTEEQQIAAYIEGDLMDPGITESDEIEYAKARLERIRFDFKGLVLQKREVERRGSQEHIGKVRAAIAANYVEHKDIVKQLLKLGVKVDHPFGIL